VDILGIVLTNIILGAWLAPPLLFLTSLLGQFDYFSITLKYLIPLENENVHFAPFSIVHRLLGSFLCQVTVFEQCRTFRVLLGNILCIGSLLANRLAQIQQKSKKGVDPRLLIDEYWILNRVHSKLHTACESIVYVLYQSGSFLIVCIYATSIIGWKFLSPSAYLIAPSLFPLVTVVFLISVNMAVKTVTMSQEILREWRSNVGLMVKSGNRAWNRRMVRTFRPMGFPVKGLGLFNAELKRTIFERVLFSTQDAVLAAISFV